MHLLLLVLCLLVGGTDSVNLIYQPGAVGTDIVETVTDLIHQNCIFFGDNLFLRNLAYVETKDGSMAGHVANFYGGIWQVTKPMFDETQRGQSILQPKIDEIRQAFHIDWRAVTWQDLRKPLYSGLAAALYLTLKAGTQELPQTVEAQGKFWGDRYHTGGAPYNYTSTVEQMKTVCRSNEVTDVVFIIDGSSSISPDDFTRAKTFVKNIIEAFPVAADKTHISLVKYATSVSVEFPLNRYYNKNQIVNAVSAMTQPGGDTNTAGAINKALDSVFPTFSGGRPHVPKVVILLTDGKSDDEIDTRHAADRIHLQGIGTFAIGVGGGVDKPELDMIATSPSCIHSFIVPGYRQLHALEQEILTSTCNVPLYANWTVTCQLGKCPVYAFPIDFPRGITIEANVSCGSANVFTDFKNYLPSGSHNLLSQLLNGGDVVRFFQPAVAPDNDFLYISTKDLSHVTGCSITLTPFIGDKTDTSVHVTCTQNHNTRNCTCADFDAFKCKGNGFQWPPNNPCTPENIRNNKLRFPDVLDNTKFLMCDKVGNIYLVQCPPKLVYNPDCQTCYGANTQSVLNCNVPYTGSNPCTADNILHNHMFFPYPRDDTKFIHCDVWGHAWVVSCPPTFLWFQQKLTCEHPDTSYNPCHVNSHGMRFFAYPGDAHKYIECIDSKTTVVFDCPPNQVWDDCVKTCVPLDRLSRCGRHKLHELLHTTSFRNFYTTASVPIGHGKLVPNPWVYPCTYQHVKNDELFHPYPLDATKYLQCDLSGYQWLQSCRNGDTFDPNSHTCVDGRVHVDGIIGK